jgi:hypothetical protein
MSNVEMLAPDAILYLIAVLDQLERSVPKFHMEGNAPRKGWCARLLADSGFYKYVRAQTEIPTFDDHVLSVRQGVVVENDQARALKYFAANMLDRPIDKDSRSIYATLIECMANTQDHAHPNDQQTHKWRMLAALFSKGGKKIVRFAFLDTGIGIPASVRRNGFADIAKTDSDFIHAAVTQTLRSGTRLVWRGKGLRKIYSFQQKQFIDQFCVISAHGHVNFATGQSRLLVKPFNGTLLTWDFV